MFSSSICLFIKIQSLFLMCETSTVYLFRNVNQHLNVRFTRYREISVIADDIGWLDTYKINF